MKSRSLIFQAPGEIDFQEEDLPPLPPDQVLVETLYSAISPGTELMVYRGQFPPGMEIDKNIPSLAGRFGFPLKYGYAVVGKVLEAGIEVGAGWEGKLVFAFHAHQSCFQAKPEELLPLPDGISPVDAVFLPNMETAVNFLMDGAPLVGENVVVFGQGIVGLLTTALLCQFPLEQLITLDRYLLRRQASLELGAFDSLDPGSEEINEKLVSILPQGADLTYELSGDALALDQAIHITGFAGRVVIGSWYGQKRVNLDLGGRFHRSRIMLISSQVSTINPSFSGRWDKARRYQVAWEMIQRIRPSRWITHKLPFTEAMDAYQLLDQSPQDAIQVVFTYNG